MQLTKKLTRKEQIKKVAQNMFRERGYSATSMRDLANAVGIEAASLYNHIKSKEDILRQICFGIADDFFHAIEQVEQSNLPAEEKLKQAISQHVKVITNNLDASAVFLHEWRFLSEPYLSDFKKLRDSYEQSFKKIIIQGKEEGIFKAVDEKFYCLTLFSALNWIYDWYKPTGLLSPQQIAEQLSNLLLEGIKK